MTIGIWQLVIILAIVIIIFGGSGKVSSILRDLGKGLKAFKKEVSSEDENKPEDNNPSITKKDDEKKDNK